MAVRFLPGPEERGPAPVEDRKDLAEVIEFRGALKQRAWADTKPSQWERRPAVETNASVETEASVETGASVEAVGSAETCAADESSGSGAAEIDTDAFEADGFDDDEPGADEAEAGPVRTSYEDGVRVLGRRARSSGELREELLRLGHDAAEVEAVIDEFERSLYLDDVGLARSVTEKLRGSKRSSRSQIRMKLIARKLPDSAIETALGELDTDEEFELLREAAADRARKLSGLDRQTAERRLLGFLARRGWSGEPAMRAARAALDGAARPSGGVRFR